eukprot:GFUD01027014.1.p1 GENE.GFUD01027014.1~~GFUD01027014.1.p1  ORF type:complete len:195 (-),score=49.93 GFUD01027014.1:144-728(-)
MPTLRTAALLLCVLVSVSANPEKKKKRAASCDIDPSLPCECSNPFLGTPTFYLGDPKRNCKAAKACYVDNKSGCSDARSARGGGRCQSKSACDPPAEPTEPPTVSEGPGPDGPKTDEIVTPTATPPPPKPSTCPPPPGGSKICECLEPQGCSGEGEEAKCEVDCQADCNDLTSENDKCFSFFACLTGLLFEEEC